MQEPTDPRAQRIADQTLTMFALMSDLERGAFIGATIACAAALAEKTPITLLEDLKEAMPDDELWTAEYADRTRRKCRNATRWFKGANIAFVGRGNQG